MKDKRLLQRKFAASFKPPMITPELALACQGCPEPATAIFSAAKGGRGRSGVDQRSAAGFRASSKRRGSAMALVKIQCGVAMQNAASAERQTHTREAPSPAPEPRIYKPVLPVRHQFPRGDFRNFKRPRLSRKCHLASGAINFVSPLEE
jgi:hypothetical protein